MFLSLDLGRIAQLSNWDKNSIIPLRTTWKYGREGVLAPSWCNGISGMDVTWTKNHLIACDIHKTGKGQCETKYCGVCCDEPRFLASIFSCILHLEEIIKSRDREPCLVELEECCLYSFLMRWYCLLKVFSSKCHSDSSILGTWSGFSNLQI